MTEPSIYYPEHLTGRQLDAFLEKGWYRMFQSVFTTHYINEKEKTYRVFWLRYNLKELELNRSNLKLLRQNQRFSHKIKKVVVNSEIEELYAIYKTGISFNPSDSVTNWLYGDAKNNVFDSYAVEIRDSGFLIGAGVFDKGAASIAGIMNFYHPDYKKFSIGKYLMLLKIEYAKKRGLDWYYPGYIIHGYPRFDYKLFADKNAAELYIPEADRWYKYHPDLPDAVEATTPNEEKYPGL